MFKKKERIPQIGEHKFCPACGIKLRLEDTFCLKCGYSFAARAEKNKNEKVNLRNVIIVIVILITGYFGLRYVNGQSIWPRSLADAISTLWAK